jgi:hypothetical protein
MHFIKLTLTNEKLTHSLHCGSCRIVQIGVHTVTNVLICNRDSTYIDHVSINTVLIHTLKFYSHFFTYITWLLFLRQYKMCPHGLNKPIRK